MIIMAVLLSRVTACSARVIACHTRVSLRAMLVSLRAMCVYICTPSFSSCSVSNSVRDYSVLGVQYILSITTLIDCCPRGHLTSQFICGLVNKRLRCHDNGTLL